ncbi:PREDICTED: RNA-binding protein 34-like [Rhagoletis zephyria]|uniref:RNA-binding protein 34-like n=1 Tax=Rhagoletis zephyria TaxID=28612 RepID=UPI0008112AE4|nr:PREDICTED: RNA-binding protein 34-like [Rhagoletis zephyria]
MASSDSENSDVEISNEEEQQSEEQSEGSEAEDAPTKEVEEGEESVAEETREKEPNSARLARTIFIGNLKANFELKELKKILKQYGSVDSIRIRSVAPAKNTLSKKVALLSKQIHPGKNNVNAYAVFKSFDSVEKALALNGTQFDGNTIQVDRITEKPFHQNKNSIFLGNLSFKTTEEELRKFFSECGPIDSVRLIRDRVSGMGKGFGYVNFEAKDAVVLALEKNGQTFNDREIRVQPYQYKQEKSGKKKGKKMGKNKKGDVMRSPRKQGRPSTVSGGDKPVRGGMKRKGPPVNVSQQEFKGEVAQKKFKGGKKSVKSVIKSKVANKHKKKIAEILSK